MKTALILKYVMAGGIMVCAWAIFLFFLRFWKRTRDRLFAWFAAAFLLLGIERLSLAFSTFDHGYYVYLVRLCAFVLIIFAIWEKNRENH